MIRERTGLTRREAGSNLRLTGTIDREMCLKFGSPSSTRTYNPSVNSGGNLPRTARLRLLKNTRRWGALQA